MWYARARMTWWNYRLTRIVASIAARHGLVVQGGPFAGMVYVASTVSAFSQGVVCKSALVPKLLGSYEAELHQIVAKLLKTRYPTVVNIGCGEGYYAVGFALRLPGARIYAFDTDPPARNLCAELAHANGVEARVIVAGECDHHRLAALTLERALIVCDCEGCELDLLRPDLVPGLKACDIVVELHDFIDPRISEIVLSRFEASHKIRLVESTERDPSNYSVLRNLAARDQRLAVNEFRPHMEWAFMRSKSVPIDEP